MNGMFGTINSLMVSTAILGGSAGGYIQKVSNVGKGYYSKAMTNIDLLTKRGGE